MRKGASSGRGSANRVIPPKLQMQPDHCLHSKSFPGCSLNIRPMELALQLFVKGHWSPVV